MKIRILVEVTIQESSTDPYEAVKAARAVLLVLEDSCADPSSDTFSEPKILLYGTTPETMIVCT